MTIHVVGAGLAGLAAATALAATGAAVRVYEAAGHAGGRCRSFFDATLNRTLDNGNHLILGAYGETFRYLDRLEARAGLSPLPPHFAMAEPAAGLEWTVRPQGLWLLNRRRRPPGTTAIGLLADAWRLSRAAPGSELGTVIDPGSAAFARLWAPFAVGVMNTPAPNADARLLWRTLTKTLMAGPAACRPWLAPQGLGAALVDPALRLLAAKGGAVAYHRRLTALTDDGRRVRTLAFGDREIDLDTGDRVILALPPRSTAGVLPELAVIESRPIVNVHFRLDHPVSLPRGAGFLGLIGCQAQWIFVRGDVVSLTVSAAADLAARSGAEIAARLWPEIAPILGPPGADMPAFRVIKEKAATIDQSPRSVDRRPGRQTKWDNVFLAGDWIDTGLPATIESAILSGHRAAQAC